MNKPTYRIDDSLVAQLAKLLQLAILTGTPVVDNLRTLEVELDDATGYVTMSAEYKAGFDSAIKRMLDEAERISTAMQNTVADDVGYDSSN